MVTIALASLIIGETLVGKRTMLRRIPVSYTHLPDMWTTARKKSSR